MTIDESTRIMKALADPSRIRLVRALLDGERCAEELALRLDLAASTVSFHMARLEKAGLVTRRKDQYYINYAVNRNALAMTLGELVAAEHPQQAKEDARVEKATGAVLRSFFRHGKLTALPVQRKKRLVILEQIVRMFKPDVIYTEPEVDAIIHELHPDHCTLRRLLVDEGFMIRSNQRYRRTDTFVELDRKESPMSTNSHTDWKRAAKREYKERPLQAGIFTITNTVTGKTYLGSSLNMHGPLNKHRLMLTTGGHINSALQKDWNLHGESAFRFQVEELVKPPKDAEVDMSEELAKLERQWIARFQPFQEKCYNKNEKIREV